LFFIENENPNLLSVTSKLFQRFSLAVSIVMSRAFTLSDEGTALIPYGDMCNHSNIPHGVFTYDNEKKVFQIKCVKECKSGEEFFISYGDKSNTELLVEYGFILKENFFDSIEISINPTIINLIEQEQVVGLWKEKEIFMEMKGIRRSYKLEQYDLPFDFLLSLRIYHMSKLEFENFKQNFQLEPISLDNENKVLATATLILEDLLRNYTQSMEEDEILLKKTNWAKVQMILKTIIAEKQIIHELLKDITPIC